MNQPFLKYSISGKGESVVLLHGFLESSDMWKDLLPLFSQQVLCIDLNGHGKSQFQEILPCTIVQMAEQVAEVIRYEKLSNITVIGHSMGGYVGLELMKLTPVKQLILLHSHPWEDSDEKKKDRTRVSELVLEKKNFFLQEAIPGLFLQPEKHKEMVNQYIDQATKMKAEAIAWCSIAMRNRIDNSKIMENNPEKYTVIMGTQDRLIPFHRIQQFCQTNHIELLCIENTGHMSQIEKPETLKKLLKQALEK